MKLRTSFLICYIIIFQIAGVAQSTENITITGQVTDSESGLPLPGTNVFINNSTYGCAANDQGIFKITGLKPGAAELIVSRIGYEMISRELILQPGIHYSIYFEIGEKPILADEVKVYAEGSKKRRKQVRRFSKLFLGASANAKQCEIVNPEVLRFVKDKPFFGQMVVEAEAPINIINQGLGYELRAHLIVFNWSGTTGEYAVKLSFNEIQPENPEQAYEWRKARKETYMGSFRHFIRTLTLGEVYDAGFEIYRGVMTPDTEPSLEFVINPIEELVDNCQPEAIKKFTTDNALFIVYGPDRKKASALTLDSDFVYIDTTGTVYPPRNTRRNGYWFSQRIADELPMDYLPR